VIYNYVIFGQQEANYLAINKTTEEVFMVDYEEIDEFLYGDGEIPKFENIYPLAKNSESFLDVLVELLKYQKILSENLFDSLEKRVNISEPFKIEAIKLAGGADYEPWRIF
jgi:hypothetical protein